MRRLRKLICGFCLILAITLVHIEARADIPKDDSFLNQLVELHLSNASVLDVLNTLSVEYRVPIGFERSLLDRRERKFNIDIKGSVRTVLDSIVRQEPVYRWNITEGVINFVAIRGQDLFLERLLKTRISRYAPKKGLNIFELRNAIADLPEVQRLLKQHNKTVLRVSDYVYYPSIYSNKNLSLSISNTDVRGVLNMIVRDSEHKLWVLGWRDQNRSTLALGF